MTRAKSVALAQRKAVKEEREMMAKQRMQEVDALKQKRREEVAMHYDETVVHGLRRRGHNALCALRL